MTQDQLQYQVDSNPMPIDLLSPLKNLETLAAASQARGEFRDGYLMAIRHAIELAEVQQQRIELAAVQQQRIITEILEERAGVSDGRPSNQ